MAKENIYSLIETLADAYNALTELDVKTKENADLRRIIKRMNGDNNALFNQVSQLKKENHILQLFIEEHVDAETKKLIFK